MPENCQNVMRKSWDSHEPVMRKAWDSHRTVIRQSWDSHETIMRQFITLLQLQTIAYISVLVWSVRWLLSKWVTFQQGGHMTMACLSDKISQSVSNEQVMSKSWNTKFPESFQKFPQKCSKSFKKVSRKLQEIYQKVVRNLPEICQRVARKLPESF